MNEFDEIKEMVEKSKFDGYKAAFLGAMAGWEKSMQEAAYLLAHVTGTGNESVEHYWPRDCETCAKVAKFIYDWKYDVAIRQYVEKQKGGRTSGAVDGGEGAGLPISSTPEANPAPEVLSQSAHHH